MATDKNCLSYWLPILEEAGVPVPRTEIVRFDGASWEILEPKTDEEEGNCLRLVEGIRAAGWQIGTPFFLRTGLGSGKHEWARTCFVRDMAQIRSHVYALTEWSESVDIMGLPINVWAVREMLPTRPIFHAFWGEMPVVEEVRAFVFEGRMVSWSPYWPEESIQRPSLPDWQSRMHWMNEKIEKERPQWEALSIRVAEAFAGNGAWSVDCLYTDRGWFVTDMALAADSYGCPQELQRAERPHPPPPLSDEERTLAAMNALGDGVDRERYS